MKLSIIIPVFNEAETIKKFLHYVIKNLSGEIKVEILIIDGGSEDKTEAQVLKFLKDFLEKPLKPNSNKYNAFIKIKFLNSEQGRAKQMNFGAKNATGEILYFLHADSLPPQNFDFYILKEVQKGNPAGCFRMKFDSSHWWLQLAGWLTKYKWKGCRGGDQSQFITKSLFEEIEGFDENYVIYEDNILINELYKRNKFVVIPEVLTTSARRYREKGIWNLQYHFWVIHLKRWLGADAKELYEYYAKHLGTKNSKNS